MVKALLLLGILVALAVVVAEAQNADTSIPRYTGGFRWGNNAGYTSGWDDAAKIRLGPKIGQNARRVKLPEYHLEKWGYNIEVSDSQVAESVGQSRNTAFLVGASDAHTLNPAPNGANEQYPPSNLYQPIWQNKTAKVVNPSNYWASYLSKLWSNYKTFVDIYEIWNEPDFTNNWEVTFGKSDNNDWWHRAPTSAELTNWKGSNFFSYVRLLRVTYEVLHTLSPTALVAIGGVGYPSFVDALCRYTDNPSNGAKATSYPLTGCSYFDVVSFHYYPQYSVYNLQTKTWNQNKDSDSYALNFITHKKNFDFVLRKYGYGVTKPAKKAICTETGVSTTDATSGGDKLRRNYLTKVALLSKANKVDQVHVYMLNDGTGTDAFSTMGSYPALTTNKNPNPKSSSVGGATMRDLKLWEAYYDQIRTPALQAGLPAGYIGYAFSFKTKGTIYAIWRRAQLNGLEAGEGIAAGTVTFTSSGSSVVQYKWDFNVTKATTNITKNASTGKFSVSVGSTPTFFKDSNTDGMTVNGKPKALTSFALSTRTANSITIKFSQPTNSYPADHFLFRYRKQGSTGAFTTSSKQFQFPSVTVTGLATKVAYEIQVAAVAVSFGTGPWAGGNFTTL